MMAHIQVEPELHWGIYPTKKEAVAEGRLASAIGNAPPRRARESHRHA